MATRVAHRAGQRRRVRRPRPRRRRDNSSRVALALIIGALLFATALALRDLYLRLAIPSTSQRMSMEEARAFNASVPFVRGAHAGARPFKFRGTPAARLQAAECLATAGLYEAGDDERGQRAVMQVVLNRVRARGFPRTVCGVVYQGSALPTGCQFSFTCDGSFRRRPQRSGWAAARKLARRALAGAVFRPVGAATHYHADWTVPYWMSSLDKIAQVRSHIFYRSSAPGDARAKIARDRIPGHAS